MKPACEQQTFCFNSPHAAICRATGTFRNFCEVKIALKEGNIKRKIPRKGENPELSHDDPLTDLTFLSN